MDVPPVSIPISVTYNPNGVLRRQGAQVRTEASVASRQTHERSDCARRPESILSGAPFFYLRDDFDRSLGLIGRVAKLIPHAVNKE
jgi:hypothetical protein